MKIVLLWVGKTKNSNLLSLLHRYEERIGHFCELLQKEVKAAEEVETDRVVAKEGERLLAKIQPDDYVVALDALGESLTSEELGALIADKKNHSLKNLVFVVGGHWGLSMRVKTRANKLLSLSRMTLSHEMTRLILVEQIYRAFTWIHHIPYHK